MIPIDGRWVRLDQAIRGLSMTTVFFLAVQMVVLGVASASPSFAQTAPQIKLGVDRAAPGDEVTITGTGFTGGDQGVINFDYGGPDPQDLGDFLVMQQEDSFSTTIVVPDRPAGDYAIAALVSDPNGARALASTTLTLDAAQQLQPQLHITPDHAAPGGQVTITGTGSQAVIRESSTSTMEARIPETSGASR